MKTGKVITRENPFWNSPIRFTEQIIWPSPVVHILTCRYEYPEMEYTSQLFKNRTVNISMFNFYVSCLHFKSNILMKKLTEIMPGINYHLSSSLSKCFTKVFWQAHRILLDLHFSCTQIQNLLWLLEYGCKWTWKTIQHYN
jgi:hypothetical protein